MTYLSPIFSGFQFGASYTPEIGNDIDGREGNSLDDVAGDFGDGIDLAIRYEGEVGEVGVIAGAGYSSSELEASSTGTFLGVAGLSADDRQSWNVGLDLDYGPFGVGVVYLDEELGFDDVEADTLVIGADYTTGPFKLGISYYTQDLEIPTTSDLETDRYTGGVVYDVAPGLDARVSISHVEHDELVDDDGTAFIFGSRIQF